MKSRELNQRLIAAFPSLKPAYRDEVDWQDGDDTGSHVVFGDVFTPLMRELLVHGDYLQARKYLGFLEDLLAMGDAYAEEVVAFSVIESLYYDTLDRTALKAHLGDGCRRLWEEFEEFDKREGVNSR